MKRKFLIWSALLTVVFGAALLQSCTADEDTFATEEYGYYTDEEIEAIMALAEKYDLDVEVRFNNYGKKKPLSDFETKFQAISQLKGRYEMVPVENNDEVGHSICRKVETLTSRTTSNSLEKGSWNKSKIVGVQKTDKNGFPYYDNYDISVTIEWDFTTSEPGKRLESSISISNLSNVESEISAGVSGSESISFSGKIKGDDIESLIEYRFKIDGDVNRKTRKGDFIIE